MMYSSLTIVSSKLSSVTTVKLTLEKSINSGKVITSTCFIYFLILDWLDYLFSILPFPGKLQWFAVWLY